MSQELLYTSAPRGLKPGSRGFCTVLSTQGMAAPLATALEGLSGYRPIFPAGDALAARNPIVHSHLKLQTAGKVWHVLSRIADFGLDYSQRANKLAHHVVLEKAELMAGGPANLLLTAGILRTNWEGDPKVVGMKPVTREATPPSGVCNAWRELTGDAGWAGALAESFLHDPERLVILLFAPGQYVLPLFAEAISLLPPERRWDVTFSTYFTGLATGTTCVWRALIHDSKEARDSIRFVNALRLELTSSLGAAKGGALVDAARSGVRPYQSNPPSVPTSSPLNEEFANAGNEQVEFSEAENRQVEFADDESAESQGRPPVPQSPPRLAPGRPTIPTQTPANPNRRKLGDVIAEEAYPRRWPWITLTAVILLTASSFGIGIATGRFKINSLFSKQDQQSQALNGQTPTDTQDADVTIKTHVAHSPPASATPATSNNSSVSASDSGNPGASVAAANPPAMGSTQLVGAPNPATQVVVGTGQGPSQGHSQPPVPVMVPQRIDEVVIELSESKTSFVIHGFDWQGPKRPDFDDVWNFAQAYKSNNQYGQQQFIQKFGSAPPRMQLLLPAWIKWKLKPPKQKKGDTKTLFEIAVANNDLGSPHAFFNLKEKPNSGLEYILKRGSSEEAQHLAWCAVDIYNSNTSSLPSKRVLLAPLAEVPSEMRSLTKPRRNVEWKTNMPFDAARSPQLRIDEFVVRFGNIESDSPTTPTWDSQGCRLVIEKISAILSHEAEINSGKQVAITIKAVADSGHLKFSVAMTGMFEEDGIFKSADGQLVTERQTLSNSKLGDSEVTLGPLISGLFDTKRDQDPVEIARKAIDTFLKESLPKSKMAAGDDKIKLAALEEIENNLKVLPDKMGKLRERHKKYIILKHQLEDVQIVSAKVSYDLFESTGSNLANPIKAYVVKFDESPKGDAGQRGDSK